MNFVIKLFPEITIKSPPVRKRMSRQLTDNLRLLLKQVEPSARVRQDWDKLEVTVRGDAPETARAIADLLGRVPGIANYAQVHSYPLGDMDTILEQTLATWGASLAGKTFCVRVKRNGEHAFTSTDVERYVGGGLNQRTQAKGVQLRDPDVTVRLEIHRDTLYVVDRFYQGLGGFPIGTQDAVLSLISGGFDSTVASYQCIKRGLRTHYLFFNLGGPAHEVGVKEIAYFLWRRFGASHRVKFITVPFDGVVKGILEHVDPSCMGVVLKRMMLRAANQVAQRAGLPALVTGEAVAQVSSQTLTNLAVIDRASECLVLRPLAMMDKGTIIDQCRAIGAEELAASMPEYCGVISVRPSAHLRLDKVEAQEKLLPESLLSEAMALTTVQAIDALQVEIAQGVPEVPVVSVPGLGQVVVDIRHPTECELRPLPEDSAAVQIPFYSLDSAFADLTPDKQYLLYCERGVMSQMHAVHLHDQGFSNVGVYRPE